MIEGGLHVGEFNVRVRIWRGRGTLIAVIQNPPPTLARLVSKGRRILVNVKVGGVEFMTALRVYRYRVRERTYSYIVFTIPSFARGVLTSNVVEATVRVMGREALRVTAVIRKRGGRYLAVVTNPEAVKNLVNRSVLVRLDSVMFRARVREDAVYGIVINLPNALAKTWEAYRLLKQPITLNIMF